jgi:hypothetical protein
MTSQRLVGSSRTVSGKKKDDHHQRTPTSRNSIFFIKKEKIVFVPGLIVGVFEIVLSLIKVILMLILQECQGIKKVYFRILEN